VRYGCKGTRTSWRIGKQSIPVSVPIAYDALKAAAVKGKTVGTKIFCPHCRAAGTLVYLSRWVARGSRWPGRSGIEDRQTPVPLCRCEACRKCFRVLPVEIPPFKSYTRAVIETACTIYAAADRPTESLRQTVARMGKGHPHPSAVHGWLGGLGARALGRLDRGKQTLPVAALITESDTRLRDEVLAGWTQPQPVSACKYRSPQRHERLEACARLFNTAQRLFPQHAHPWCAWEYWLQSRFHVTAWGFPSRFRCTAIQHHAPRGAGVPCATSNTDPKQRTKGKAHGARSPP